MNRAALDRIASAVLYEGYLLYPYRGSSLKNQQRWTFGGLAPRARANTGASTSAQTEVIVRGPAEARVEVIVRFLQLCERRIEGSPGRGAPVWHEAIDQEAAAPHASLGELAARPLRQGFGASGARWTTEGFVRRKQELVGQLDLFAWPVGEDAWRLRARVENLSPCAYPDFDDELALMASMHLLLGVDGGAFESSLDPDVGLVSAAAACKNHGVWPVLAGAPGARDTMIAAPIILYDYPCVAPESPGDLYDGTEIDEILTLRVLTMTEAEKAEARALDERARRLIDRTEALGEADLRRLHASMRARPHDALRPGARVRLHPHGTRDILDLALAGKTGVIASVEHDAEGRVLCAVLVDDDPGRDLGADGKPGHRFFFHADEVELT